MSNRKNKKLILYLMFSIVIMLCLSLSFIYAETIEKPDYSITFDQIAAVLKLGAFIERTILITNNRPVPMSLSFSVDGDVADLARLDKSTMRIDPGATSNFTVLILGENLSAYSGDLVLSGDITEQIPIDITVSDVVTTPVDAVMLNIDILKEKVTLGDTLKFEIDIQNLLSGQKYNVSLQYSIDNIDEKKSYKFNNSFLSEEENIVLATTHSFLKDYHIPHFLKFGDYVLNVKAEFLGLSSTASRRFTVEEAFLDYMILGILPVRWVLLVSSFIFLGLAGFIIYKKKKGKEKRYVSKIDFTLLPKAGARSIFLGKIAETEKKTYFELEQLAMHTLVAGSTGGGKTVSAEVVVEEALMKGVSVIVFDPTAQWTGFLRKNTDPKMFLFYPRFGLKKTDARAFNGNVHQIMNARQIIEIVKYIKPGEINVFSVNRLDPSDVDILVANTIRQVFRSNLPEAKQIKLIIIFDEVHRLLPKFGGSGQGFLQIERACREFRKWGVGLMLISQVLTDFVGETKANINTEIQMRTRDQGDLERIKNKYGAYMLQSLLKSATGTGMIENSAYNKGNPYFVQFRPLFHEHARLTDAELENYNKYNDRIEDLEFQIAQLEKEGLDVFDLKLELKMALDKVKSGSFNMVDIYLESLEPRITGNWEKLGKKPQKRELKLVTEEELQADMRKAQEARAKMEQAQGAISGGGAPAGGVPAAAPAPPKIPPGLKKREELTLVDGTKVNTIQQLIDAINVMKEEQLTKHVNDEKHDFADWIKKDDKEIGEKVAKAKTKEQLIIELEKTLSN